MRTLQIQGQEFKKQVILKEAVSILSHKPYEAVTMDEVAKALGCGKSTLYKYFQSKDLLFADAIYTQLEEFTQQMEKFCFEESDTLAALNHCLETSYWFFRQNRLLFSSWLRYKSDTAANRDLLDKIQQLMKQKQNHVSALFQRGIEEGWIYPFLDASLLARMTEKIFLSCVFSPWANETEEDEANLSFLKQILCSGMLTPAALVQPSIQTGLQPNP